MEFFRLKETLSFVSKIALLQPATKGDRDRERGWDKRGEEGGKWERERGEQKIDRDIGVRKQS